MTTNLEDKGPSSNHAQVSDDVDAIHRVLLRKVAQERHCQRIEQVECLAGDEAKLRI